jgi:hypothetical protein
LSAVPVSIGDTFNRLTVVAVAPSAHGLRRFSCRCSCGNSIVVAATYLTRNRTKSCGCLSKDQVIAKNRTHGLRHTPEYPVWVAMKARCLRESDACYYRYGGRGITVCREWQDDFARFLSDMGRRPTPQHTLDRINNDGHYEPGNCRWATRVQQNRNKRNNRRMTLNGETMTMQEWAERLGIHQAFLSQRLRLGWSDERTLTEAFTPSTNRARDWHGRFTIS